MASTKRMLKQSDPNGENEWESNQRANIWRQIEWIKKKKTEIVAGQYWWDLQKEKGNDFKEQKTVYFCGSNNGLQKLEKYELFSMN